MVQSNLEDEMKALGKAGGLLRQPAVLIGLVVVVGLVIWVALGSAPSKETQSVSSDVVTAPETAAENTPEAAASTEPSATQEAASAPARVAPQTPPAPGPATPPKAEIITKDKLGKSKAGELVGEIADNVRSVYDAGQKSPPAEDIAAQITAKLFPSSALNKTKDGTENPWGGTVQVHFVKDPLSGFAVEFTLPDSKPIAERRKICAEAINSAPGSLTTFGGLSKVVPNKMPPAASGEGKGPLLTLIKNATTWKNVTGAPVTQFFGAEGQEDCKAFAFVYRL